MQETDAQNIGTDILADYESTIHSIEVQLEVNKEEQKNLKTEIYELISENEKLTLALDNEYQDKINKVNKEYDSELFRLEVVSNLQKQLDICKKEKERVVELYNTSLKLIEKLEEELSAQKDSEVSSITKNASSSIVAVLEAKLKNTKEHLEMVMNGREQLENENIKYQTEIAKLKLNIESNNKIIDQMKLREGEFKNKFMKLEQEYILLNATYECVVKTRNELESKLENYDLRLQSLVQKNNESKTKVEEALDLVDKALMEKESAILREIQSQEEITKLQVCLNHVIDEAGKKVGLEVEEIRKKYETNIQTLTDELSQMKKAFDEKSTEYKKLSLKYKKLEKVVSSKLDKEKICLIKGSETELTILENNLDSAYQEVERLKLKYKDLEKEKIKLEEEFSGLIEKHQSLIKDKEFRETSFEEIVRELQTEINEKIRDLSEATSRNEFYLNQVREVQIENERLKNLQKNCNCKRLKAKIEKLKETCVSQRTELQSHIESQMKLNEVWKSEIKDITGKFEEKIREMKKECSQLKAENKKLSSELNAARKKNFPPENE